MNKASRLLKIPGSLYKKANENTMLNDVVFYYQLKCISDHGYFDSMSVAKTINLHLGVSTSTIWKRINSCIDKGLIIKYSNGYRLISYDSLFQLLGYDMSPNCQRNRKGSFKIHKITSYDIKNLKYVFAFIDIRQNLKGQLHNAWNNLRQDNRYAEPKLYCGSKREKLDLLNPNNVRTIEMNDETIYMHRLAEVNGRNKLNLCNPDITLSLSGICRLLGVASTQTAHNVINKLKQLQLLDSINRMILVGYTQIGFEDFYNHYDKRYYQLGSAGCVLRRISNKITVTGVL